MEISPGIHMIRGEVGTRPLQLFLVAGTDRRVLLARTYQRLGRKADAEAKFERGRNLAGDETGGLIRATSAKVLAVDTR